jgi:hypothetical protein
MSAPRKSRSTRRNAAPSRSRPSIPEVSSLETAQLRPDRRRVSILKSIRRTPGIWTSVRHLNTVIAPRRLLRSLALSRDHSRSLGRDLGLNRRRSSNEPRIRMESSYWRSLASRNLNSDHLADRCIERVNYPVHTDYAREADSWTSVSIDQQWTRFRHFCSGVDFPELRHSPTTGPVLVRVAVA